MNQIQILNPFKLHLIL